MRARRRSRTRDYHSPRSIRDEAQATEEDRRARHRGDRVRDPTELAIAAAPADPSAFDQSRRALCGMVDLSARLLPPRPPIEESIRRRASLVLRRKLRWSSPAGRWPGALLLHGCEVRKAWRWPRRAAGNILLTADPGPSSPAANAWVPVLRASRPRGPTPRSAFVDECLGAFEPRPREGLSVARPTTGATHHVSPGKVGPGNVLAPAKAPFGQASPEPEADGASSNVPHDVVTTWCHNGRSSSRAASSAPSTPDGQPARAAARRLAPRSLSALLKGENEA